MRPIFVLFVFVLCVSCTPKMYKTSLFFGLDIPQGGVVSGSDWENFIHTAVSPRFPEGLSVFEVEGKWKDTETGKTITEGSKNIVLFYPVAQRKQANLAIERIRQEYKMKFKQQAIMRIDYGKVKVAF